MKKRIFTDEEINKVIELFSNGITVTEIYNITKISTVLVRKILIDHGFVTPTKFKYSVNHFIFNEIDNKEKAYWLGFLFADGFVRKRENRGIYELKLKISKKDEEHLIKFKNFLQSTYPIKKDISKVKYLDSFSISECVSLSITSKQIFNDLFKLGCIPNKTNRIEKPNIKKEFFPHFIRGYFDGDGCITMGKNEKNKQLNFTSSSLEILKWINKTLSSNNINDGKINIGSYSRLCYYKKNCFFLIYDFLYKNSNICLNRKKEKFEKILETYKEIKIVQKNLMGQ